MVLLRLPVEADAEGIAMTEVERPILKYQCQYATCDWAIPVRTALKDLSQEFVEHLRWMHVEHIREKHGPSWLHPADCPCDVCEDFRHRTGAYGALTWPLGSP